jgi:hypothetical protein
MTSDSPVVSIEPFVPGDTATLQGRRFYLQLSDNSFPVLQAVAIAKELKRFAPSATDIVLLEGSCEVIGTCNPMDMIHADQWTFSSSIAGTMQTVKHVAFGPIEQSAGVFAVTGALAPHALTASGSLASAIEGRRQTIAELESLVSATTRTSAAAELKAQLDGATAVRSLQEQLRESLGGTKPVVEMRLVDIWRRALELIACDNLSVKRPTITEVDSETGMPTADWTFSTDDGTRCDVYFFLREEEATAVYMLDCKEPTRTAVMVEDFKTIDAQAGAEKLLQFMGIVFARILASKAIESGGRSDRR